MSFGCGRNGLFADDALSFFVVAGFRRFRSDLNGRPEFIGDLPIERRPAADQMDVTGPSRPASIAGIVPCPSFVLSNSELCIVQRKPVRNRSLPNTCLE